jgi:hypothetical protein
VELVKIGDERPQGYEPPWATGRRVRAGWESRKSFICNTCTADRCKSFICNTYRNWVGVGGVGAVMNLPELRMMMVGPVFG